MPEPRQAQTLDAEQPVASIQRPAESSFCHGPVLTSRRGRRPLGGTAAAPESNSANQEDQARLSRPVATTLGNIKDVSPQTRGADRGVAGKDAALETPTQMLHAADGGVGGSPRLSWSLRLARVVGGDEGAWDVGKLLRPDIPGQYALGTGCRLLGVQC
jgi:hypothetical protein